MMKQIISETTRTTKNIKVMIDIIQYHKEKKNHWDQLVNRSKNGTFLHLRDYMDYHSDRFLDHSFLIYRKSKLVAVFPGNIDNQNYFTHQGLSYGGLIYIPKLSQVDVLHIFEAINEELRILNITNLIYKPIPYIYHIHPAQEDLYALFRNKAITIACNISSTIDLSNKIKFIESRKSGMRKAKKNNIQIEESNGFEKFWPILNSNLENKYQKKPVHTLDEIIYLNKKFPNNIKLYCANENDKIIAGTILFITKKAVHVQYISASPEGKEKGALDLLFYNLINNIYGHFSYFDFGHSNELKGEYLNEKLIFQKEGFGARGITNYIFKYTI